MNKIVHYINIGQLEYLPACGSGPASSGCWTAIEKNITCEKCIEAIKQKPVVDEQKRRMAKAILFLHDEIKTLESYHPLHDPCFNEKNPRIVDEAKQYLEGLERE